MISLLINDRSVTKLKRSIYLIITLFYLAIVGTIAIIFNIDNDVHITHDALWNIILIITAFYLVLLLYCLYQSHEYKKQQKIQLNLLKDDNINKYFKNNLIIDNLFKRIYELKNNNILLNEQQNKWIHDVKMPLTTLKLFIDNQRDALNEEQMRTLELIALDFENHINKKIMYDKINFEIDDYKILKVDLYDITTKVIKKFRPSLMFKNLHIELAIAPHAYIVSDYRTIQYSLEQIIDNVIKYAYNDTKVTIHFSEGVLAISNYGNTIASQDINRLFEHGYTGRNSINATTSSTGIGLYMVKKSLTHLMHEVSLTSTDNITTVKIKF